MERNIKRVLSSLPQKLLLIKDLSTSRFVRKKPRGAEDSPGRRFHDTQQYMGAPNFKYYHCFQAMKDFLSVTPFG